MGLPAPTTDYEWEDSDELPWQELSGGGPVLALGFDGPNGSGGLDIDGIGRSRILVLARGRHRYNYSDIAEDGLTPEQWLLQFWPDPDSRDAMFGPPRRTGQPYVFKPFRSPWGAAMHAWSTTGWDTLLGLLQGYSEIRRVLGQLPGSPREKAQLAAAFGPWGSEQDRHGQYTWNTPAVGFPPLIDHADQQELARRQVFFHAAAAALELPPNFCAYDVFRLVQQKPGRRAVGRGLHSG